MLRRLSIRARLTLVSTLVVAVGLAGGGVLLVVALQGWTLRALDESARRDGQDIANLIDAGQAPDPLPTYGSAVAQVLDGSGQVVLASPGGDRLVPLLSSAEAQQVRAGGAVDVAGSRLGDSRRYRVVGVPAGTSAEPRTVLVAVPLADQERSYHALRWAITVGSTALTLALALASWLLIGSALRPVEELRVGAAESRGRARPVGSRYRMRMTRCGGWPRRSTTCCFVSTRRPLGSARSSRTRPTSCAVRWQPAYAAGGGRGPPRGSTSHRRR